MEKRMDNKIIIPGGAGLVGQNLVAHLRRAGYHNLVILDKHEANLAVLKRMHPDLTIEQADLAEKGPWSQHFAGADTVVMLQAQIGAPTEDPFTRNNLTSTERIIEAINAHSVPYTVHISSSVVESVADDFYTRSKTAQEKMVLASGINCVVLRPTLMFGWFDRKHLGWLSRFMQKVPVFPVPGDGKFMRQPLYVGDFCSIIMSCIQSRTAGNVYNISGLEKIDYIDIIRQIKNTTKAKATIVKIPYSLFHALLWTWALFDKNPPFTTSQLEALIAPDEFEVIDWPGIFNVTPTPFRKAIEETFLDPTYSKIEMEF